MYRKAQNLTEMAILGAIVVLITVATFTIYNNQKVNLAKRSEVNLTNADAVTQDVETSGRASVKKDYKYTSANASTTSTSTSSDPTTQTAPELVGMSVSDFEDAMSNLTYNDLKRAASLVNTTRMLAQEPAYSNLFESKNNIGVNGDTLDAQINILNAIAAKDPSKLTATENSFVSKFKTLLNSAGSYASTASSSTSISSGPHKPAVAAQAE